jgi:hypothetical protein
MCTIMCVCMCVCVYVCMDVVGFGSGTRVIVLNDEASEVGVCAQSCVCACVCVCMYVSM